MLKCPGMVIPEKIIEDVRNANDIVDIISSYLPLKRKGREFAACCPFHDEKTPSFYVIPHKQIFYCFGCHKGGNVFNFLTEYEHISFGEAVQRLADRVGIQIEFENSKESLDRSVKESLYFVHEEFTKYWHHQLLHSPEAEIARNALLKRGLSKNSIEEFRLGYSPKEWQDIPQQSKSFHINDNILLESGLVIKKETSNGSITNDFYGRFRGRLMFPICDEQGRVVAFSARALYPEDAKLGKYVNSPETPIFHKGRILFGLDKAKRSIIKEQKAIICEGQIDLISCHAAGFTNTIAPQGTALTSDHSHILKRLATEIILCLDGDEPGQQATIKAWNTLSPDGLIVRVATLPDNHDPDSFIRSKGAKAFSQFVAEAKEFFDFYLHRLCLKHSVNSDSGRRIIVQSMGESLKKANQPLLTDTYAQKTAAILGVSPQTILNEFSRIKEPIFYQPRPVLRSKLEETIKSFEIPDRLEAWLLRLFLSNESQWDWLASSFQAAWVKNKFVRRVIIEILDKYSAGEWNLQHFLDSFQEGPERNLIYRIVIQGERESIPNPEQQLQKLVLTLRDKHYDELLSNLSLQMKNLQLSDDEQLKLIQQKERLRQLKRQPLFENPSSE